MFGNLSFLELSVGMDLILINITRFVCASRDRLYADDLLPLRVLRICYLLRNFPLWNFPLWKFI